MKLAILAFLYCNIFVKTPKKRNKLKQKITFLWSFYCNNQQENIYAAFQSNGVFPMTETGSDSDILSDPITTETIKICRNRHTGSKSDICSDFNGYCTHFVGSERISQS